MRIDDHINEHNNYDEFSETCVDGSPMQVLAKLKDSGFDRRVVLEKLDFDKDSIWHGTEPGLTPVESACAGDNVGVFRLFLELGLTPNSECRGDKNYPTFPDFVYMCQASKIIAFLNNTMPGWNKKPAPASPWWSYGYTPQKNSDLQITLDKHIRRGDLSKVLWIGLRGGRLERPNVLASREFKIGSPMMRRLVWQILVSDDARGDYQNWLLRHDSEQGEGTSLPNPKMAAGEILEKIILSRSLFPNQKMLLGALTDEDKLGLLKYLSAGGHPGGRYWRYAQTLHPVLCSDILLSGV